MILEFSGHSFRGSPAELWTVATSLASPLPENFRILGDGDGEDAAKELGARIRMLWVGQKSQVCSEELLATLWRTYTRENISLLCSCPGLSELFYRYQGLPVVIVGPGPSLDKNIGALSSAVGRALIICFAQSYKALRAVGISPDLVFISDSQTNCYTYLGDEVGDAGALCLAATVHPTVAAHTPEVPRFFYFGNDSWDTWARPHLPWIPPIPSGGSVSHHAYLAACALGAKTIILCGHDHAITSAGKKYADGTRNEDLPETKGTVELPSYHGGAKVLSYVDHAHFAKVFGVLALQSQRAGIKTVNATEGGASLENMRQVPLSRAIEKWCRVSVANVRDPIYTAWSRRHTREIVSPEEFYRKAEEQARGT